MFNLLKSDIYRLVREVTFWGLLAIMVTIAAGSVGLLWFSTTPMFAEMAGSEVHESAVRQTPSSDGEGEVVLEEVADLTSKEAKVLASKTLDSRTFAYAQTLVVSGGLSLACAVFAAAFLMRDFEAGFAKNVLATRTRRTAYFAEKLILCALVSAVFLMVGMAVVDIGFWVAGFTFERTEGIGAYWGWVGLAWLAALVYAAVTACVVWLTRSSWVSGLVAAFAGSGLLASVVMSVIPALAQVFPALTEAVFWLPAQSSTELGAGATDLFASTEAVVAGGLLPPVHILVVSGVAIAACVALVFTVCKRKDV